MSKKLSRGITRKNLNQVIDEIYKRKDKMIYEEAKNICSEVANATAEKMRADVPVDTGELLQSIKLISWSNRLRFKLEVNTPYAKAQNTGAKPHTIEAKNVSALSFWWDNAGKWFIGKSVNHPGVTGNRYFSKNMDWCQKELTKQLRKLVKERSGK